MITRTLDLNNIERKIFWTLVVLIFAASAVYLYSALSLTVAGVERDRMSQASHELSTTAGLLESEYLTKSNAVTLVHAQELGFREVEVRFANTRLSIAR